MKYSDLKCLSTKTSISVFTLRKFVKAGLPHFRVGRKIFVDPAEFNDWFEMNHRVTCEPKNSNLEDIMSKALAEIEETDIQIA
jgi:hypothetical protein